MGFASLKSMAHDDESLFDLSKGMGPGYEPPEYPGGLSFSMPMSDLEQAGAGEGKPDDTMRFSAMGEVTSVMNGREDCRVEVRLNKFAGADGKFFDLASAPTICLCDPQLEKMGLEADCERGDMIHLVGTARLESVSDTEWGGEMAVLQITELTFEDESQESREG